MGPPKAKPQKACTPGGVLEDVLEGGLPGFSGSCKVAGESERDIGGSHGGERGSEGSARHKRVVRFSPAA